MNIFVYIIISIVALYLVYDMVGEWYARKMGWYNKAKFTQRVKHSTRIASLFALFTRKQQKHNNNA